MLCPLILLTDVSMQDWNVFLWWEFLDEREANSTTKA